ncbi:PTS fructose transporter subunit IIC [Candidatus Enterococcus murrayae]|uniref:PTS fructose transporter subunit IIC n=1 Tax=Candidatus Enterococcus murrayae TaxID=2815321 RepID=A0ABS3HLA9_9ENTE|nr:PTS fructose transporter subunit IIC [Enterococcus sp. MJM16]MBO0454220.1 PTS fructose transporter subunit IIC [Enterococcus sp. MJM16]
MAEVKSSGKLFTNLKQHALTAISYLIPIVVSGGFMLAIGSLLGGGTIESIKDSYNFWDVMYTMGGLVLGMLPVVIGTGISFSIADKPGIAPGFLVGLISINMNAGFIGGFIGGYIAGYLTKFLRDHIKVPGWAEGLKPMLILPFLSSIVIGLVMYFVLGIPIAAMTDALNNFLRGLDTNQKLMFGLIVGVLSAVDYGGPINKVVFAFLLSLQSDGINEPMAVLMLASMVTPFGMSMAYFFQKLFRKNIYNKMEVETLKTAFPMGVCMITEGCYPIIFNDLWRCIVSTGVGAGVGGALSMIWGAGSPVPHGGLFAMVTMTNPLAWFAALMIGSLVDAILLMILKKPVAYDEVKDDGIETEKDIDLSEMKIS